MQIVKSSQTNKVIPTKSTKIFEYLMDEETINCSVAQINGSYPENGFAVNEICKELVFIINGTGHIVTEKDKQAFVVGDAILIDRGEKFRWEGNFSIFMVTTPKFSADQHKIV
ncbi:hypothetical protein HY086_06280 [Candidatus Gottesmanbacteria bacterium]|nr:hypothetical protein [Candidatus Gottesmanbacteria bacterium]